MKKIKSFIRLLSLTLFGLIGFSIISCENTTDIPSIESSSPTSEPIHTHEWDEGKVTKEATCIEEGQITYSCTNCDEVKFETISALGHKEVIDEAKEATCTETGLTEGKHCEVCNEVLVAQEEVPALGHKEVIDEAKEATCTETGLTEGKHCEVCNEVLIAQEEVPALEHAYTSYVNNNDGTHSQICEHDSTHIITNECELNWVVTKEAGVNKEGLQTGTCNLCGYETTKIIPVTHTCTFEEEFVVDKEATCTEDGEKSKHCVTDGCELREEITAIPALGHNYISIVTNPTCEYTGYTTHTCSRCEDSYVDSYVNEKGHSFADWEVIVEPGCESVGTKRRDCEECDHYEEEKIAALGHNEVIDEAKEATCTETGLTDGSHCDRCNKVLVAQEEVAALGHEYESVVTDPTCVEQGYTTHTCNRCNDSYVDSYVEALGHVEVIDEAKEATCTETGLTEGSHCDRCKELLVAQEEVAALGHDYESVATNPTCVDKGYTTHTCNRCEDSYIDSYVEALGHRYGDWSETVAPGCESVGTKRRDCEACDHYEEEKIAALGHNEVIDAAKEATCTETGLTDGSHCDRCNKVLVAQEEVAALGHSYGDWEVILEPSCESTGTKRKECSNCEHFEEEVIADLGHNYDSVVIDPTCENQGYTLHLCERCNNSYTDTYTEKTEHSFIDSVCSQCGFEDYIEGTFGLEYTFLGDSYAVTGYSGFETNVIIANYYNDYKVTAIQDGFTGSSIESVFIPNTIYDIAPSAFFCCRSLTYVKLPNGLTTISEDMFSCCDSLSSIEIPNGVLTIEHGAFSGCTSLKSITISKTIEYIDMTAFMSCPSIENIIVDDNNNQFKTIDNVLYSKDGKKMLLFPSGKKDTSFEIPSHVEMLGDYAFHSNENLENVILSSNIKTISKCAFGYCTSLKEITIPSNVTTIEEGAFTNCTNLEFVYLNYGIKYINNAVFANCTSLDNITIPDSVQYIGEAAFQCCSSLSNIVLPNNISMISDCIFDSCNSLKSLYIPETVTYIGNSAFSHCSNLININIPENVTKISDYAFNCCRKLPSVSIPNSVTYIGMLAFQECTSLINVTIPEKITILRTATFRNCSNLTSISLPEGLNEIQVEAFSGCSKIETIRLPNSVERIESSVFRNCPSLLFVNIPKGVKEMLHGAFDVNCNSVTIYCEAEIEPEQWQNGWNFGGYTTIWNCKPVIISFEENGGNLLDDIETMSGMSITLPTPYKENHSFIGWYKDENLTEEWDYQNEKITSNLTLYAKWEEASVGTEGLIFTSNGDGATCFVSGYNGDETDVIIGKYYNGLTVTGIRGEAFSNCDNIYSITLPSTISYIDVEAFINCSNLKNFYVSEDNNTYKSIDGNLYTKDLKTMVSYAIGKTNTQFTLLSGVEKIEKYAFYNCETIEEIILSDSVINIDDYSFYGCISLKNITISENLSYIGNYSFYNCSSLDSIFISNKVNFIGNNAFYGCESLTIYCEQESKSNSWHYNWNSYNNEVIWNYNPVN